MNARTVETIKSWMKSFDHKAYVKDFNPYILLKCFWLFSGSYIVLNLIFKILGTLQLEGIKWFGAPFELFPETVFINFSLTILLLHSLSLFFRQIFRLVLPIINSVALGVTIWLVYFLLIRSNSSFILHSFYSWDLINLKYLDVIFISGILLSCNHQSYRRQLESVSQKGFTEDQPGTSYDDEIGNQSYSEHIRDYINSTTTEASFAIGIIGKWGSGKTDFLKRLNSSLHDQDENIIIEFNPWRSAKTEGIIEDFFSILIAQLKPYSREISNTIKNYSNKIFQPGKEIHYRIIDTLLTGMIKTETNHERYNNINNSIKRTGKRIVIFIDDLDRLNGDEIFEVLRIIRNTASFANTFFIVAMDEEYVTEALRKTNNISREDHYLKKIFQYTLFLPRIRKEIFVKVLKNFLNVQDMVDLDKNKIDRILSHIVYSSFDYSVLGIAPMKPESHFESMLDNIRDVKRFANSFRTSFDLLKEEVELIDLALLELIKVKSIKTYEALGNRELMKAGGVPTLLSLDDSQWDLFSEEMVENDRQALKTTLLYLFRNDEIKSYRRFANPNNFNLYFSYQLLDLLSLRVFSDILIQDEKEIITQFTDWENKKLSQLNILLGDIVFNNKEDLKKIITVMLKAGNFHDTFLAKTSDILFSQMKNKNLFPDIVHYKEFILTIFRDEEINSFKRAKIANSYVREEIYKGGEVLGFSRKELSNLIFSLFKDHLATHKEFDIGIWDFFLLNDIGRTSNNEIIINEDAGKLLKIFIIKTGVENYIRYFIRSYMLPSDGSFVFDPFFKQIFPEKAEFKLHLDKIQSSDKQIMALKEMIQTQWPDYVNSGKSFFYLEEKEAKKMLEYLKSNMQYSY